MHLCERHHLNRWLSMSLAALLSWSAGCAASRDQSDASSNSDALDSDALSRNTKLMDAAGQHPQSNPTTQPAEPFIEQIVAFEAADAEKMPGPGGILFVGSSTFRLWKTDVDFAGLPVINRGFGGSAMRHVNYYYDRIVEKYKPAVVAVYQGDNDIAGGQSPEAVMAEVKTFAARLRTDLPDVQLVLVPVKVSASRLRWREQQDAFNGMLRGLALANPGWVTYFDGVHLLLNEVGQPEPAYFRPDRLHLSEAGYDVWSAALRPVLTRVLERASAQQSQRGESASDVSGG